MHAIYVSSSVNFPIQGVRPHLTPSNLLDLSPVLVLGPHHLQMRRGIKKHNVINTSKSYPNTYRKRTVGWKISQNASQQTKAQHNGTKGGL